MAEWISVKDRLPEITFESNTTKYTDGVLAFDDCEDVCLGHFCISKYDGSFIFYGFTDGSEECDPLIVTHWMPLPEPPKEDSK